MLFLHKENVTRDGRDGPTVLTTLLLHSCTLPYNSLTLHFHVHAHSGNRRAGGLSDPTGAFQKPVFIARSPMENCVFGKRVNKTFNGF